MHSLIGKTALVVGASRGLGRGIAQAFGSAGACPLSSPVTVRSAIAYADWQRHAGSMRGSPAG